MKYLETVWGSLFPQPYKGLVVFLLHFPLLALFTYRDMTNQNTYPQKTKYDSLAKKLYLLFSSRRLTSKQKFATLPIKDKDYWRALAEISIKEKLWQTQQLSP